jgi:hypothetical protein
MHVHLIKPFTPPRAFFFSSRALYVRAAGRYVLHPHLPPRRMMRSQAPGIRLEQP